MPGWIIQALKLLAASLGAGAAFEAGGNLFDDAPLQGPRIPGVPDELQGLGRPFGFGRRGERRRRRRRALTASDRADIAFVAGMISKAAAKDFAVQLAARPR